MSINRIAMAALIGALITGAASAETYYWDTDGASPGFGLLFGGDWNTSAYWSTSPDGTGSTILWPNSAGDDVVFNTTNALVNGNITVQNIWSGSSVNSITTKGDLTVTLAGATSGRVITLSGDAIINVEDGAADPDLQLNCDLAGTNGFNKTGPGRMVKNSIDGYSGTTRVSEGSLYPQNNCISDASAVVIESGALLSYASGGGRSDTVGSLAGSGTLELKPADNYQSVTFGADDSSTEFSGVIQSKMVAVITTNEFNVVETNMVVEGGFSTLGTFNKIGSGTQTFSGANTYAVRTVVSGGTLLINGDQTAATNLVLVSGGVLGGSGKIGGATTVSSGGTLDPLGTLEFYQDLTLSPGSTLALDILDSGGDVIRGAAANALSLEGLIEFDFSGILAADGSVHTVLENWGSISTNGATFTPVNLGPAQTVDVSNLQSAGTITVNGAPPASFTITASAVGFGTVTPTNSTVLPGGSVNFDITPDSEYRILSVTTNGVPLDGVSFDNNSTNLFEFTWSNIQSGGSLIAAFAKQPLFWDANGTTNGFGTDLTGNWNFSEFWSKSEDGTAVPFFWPGTPGNDVVFSAVDCSAESIITVDNVYSNAAVNKISTVAGGQQVTLAAPSSSRVITLIGEGNIHVPASASAIGLRLSVDIAGTVGLHKTGSGTLYKYATDSYTGTTRISEGTLLSHNNVIPDDSAVVVEAGATLNYGDGGGRVDVVGSIAGAGSIKLKGNPDAPQLTHGGDNSSTEFSGVISSWDAEGWFVKTGTGTLTLSGDNSYDQETRVDAGSLIINGNQSSANGAITVAADAVLGGDGTVGADIVFAAGAKFQFEPSSTLTANGASVDLGNLSIAKLVGVDGSVPSGIYTLIDGSAALYTGGLANLGGANAVSLGGAKTAFFLADSGLQLVVAEPEAADLNIEMQSGNTEVVISWTSQATSTYDVESTSNLTGTWGVEASGLAGTGGLLSYTGAVSEVQNFYQVITY